MNEREVLKLALEALDGWQKDFPDHWGDIDEKSVDAIKEVLAQPEQEPLAWRNAAIRVGEDLCSVGPFGYYDMTAEQWLDWALSVVTVHAPPQRTWVGLRDSQKLAIIRDCSHLSMAQLIELVEEEIRRNNNA